jgi:hypothetical protein
MLQWSQQQAREVFAELSSQCPLGHYFTHYNPHVEQIFKVFRKLKYLGADAA